MWLAAMVRTAAAQDPPPTPLTVVEAASSVRSVGLNEAGVALIGDAGAVFSNPAGLATISHLALEGGYRSAPGGAWLASGALGWRLGQFDLGVGARVFDYGTDPASYGAGAAADGREMLGVASLVYRFGLIAVGASGKFARRRVAGDEVDASSGDAGLAVAFFDIMALAFAVQNLGGNWQDTGALAMPRLTRLGFTMNYTDPQESFRLLSTVEIQWPEGAGPRAVIGGEGGVVVRGIGVLVRAAYGGRSPSGLDRQVTFGGTVTAGALKLDYATRERDLLGARAHYFGIRLTL